MRKLQSCSIEKGVESRGSNGAAQRPNSDNSPLSGALDRYREVISQAVVAQMLEGQSAFSRKGPLSAWVVIWLMIYQRLDAKGTLAVAVRELLVGSVRRLVPQVDRLRGKPLSASTSAYSQARGRLPLNVAEKVSDLIFESLQQEPRILSGLEKPMFLLDGSSIQLPHTKGLASDYPPQSNQFAVSHWPIMRVLVAHDVVSGLAVRPCWGPMIGAGAVSEQGLAKQIMGRLPVGCGVMGDRNFGVFSLAYHADRQNHPCLFRLTEVRARKLNGGVTPNAKTDKAIRWLSSREDRRNNPELADQSSIEGRLVARKIGGAGRKPQKLYFFTTLDLPADGILEVYGYRWNIETDLRSLKQEVRLHMLDAKSKAMVEKELVLAVAAYNLTRTTMNQAAAALQLNPRQLSFSLAQDTINAFLPAFANATTDPERQELMQEMLRVFKYSKLPNRSKRPSYRRAIWPRASSFPKRELAKKRPSPPKRKSPRKE
jgi:Transposase DDE domain